MHQALHLLLGPPMGVKEVLGFVSIVFATIGFVTYIRSIYKGQTKPHAFSWIVWGVVTGLVFVAQANNGGGAGSWVTGFSTFVQFAVAGLALKYGEKRITKTDWLSFIAASALIPFWYVTKDPLLVVILASVIDICAYYPTFRKSYRRPFEESYVIYATDFLKWAPALVALDTYSLTTMLYPVVILVANASVAAMIVIRRTRVTKDQQNH